MPEGKSQVLVYLGDKARKKLRLRSAREDRPMSSIVEEAIIQGNEVGPVAMSKLREAAKSIARAGGSSVLKVILFGSYATGRAHVGSDIDLMVVERHLLGWHERAAEHRRLRAAVKLDVAVDLLLTDLAEWNEWKDEFGSVFYDAAREGKALYAVEDG